MAMSAVIHIVIRSRRPTIASSSGETVSGSRKRPDAERQAEAAVELRRIEEEPLQPVQHAVEHARRVRIGGHDQRRTKGLLRVDELAREPGRRRRRRRSRSA